MKSSAFLPFLSSQMYGAVVGKTRICERGTSTGATGMTQMISWETSLTVPGPRIWYSHGDDPRISLDNLLALFIDLIFASTMLLSISR